MVSQNTVNKTSNYGYPLFAITHVLQLYKYACKIIFKLLQLIILYILYYKKLSIRYLPACDDWFSSPSADTSIILIRWLQEITETAKVPASNLMKPFKIKQETEAK